MRTFEEYANYRRTVSVGWRRTNEASVFGSLGKKAGKAAYDLVDDSVLGMIPGWGTLKSLYTAFSSIKTIALSGRDFVKATRYQKVLLERLQDVPAAKEIVALMYHIDDGVAGYFSPVLLDATMEEFLSGLTKGTDIMEMTFAAAMERAAQKVFQHATASASQLKAQVGQKMKATAPAPDLRQAAQAVQSAVSQASKEVSQDLGQEGDETPLDQISDFVQYAKEGGEYDRRIFDSARRLDQAAHGGLLVKPEAVKMIYKSEQKKWGGYVGPYPVEIGAYVFLERNNVKKYQAQLARAGANFDKVTWTPGGWFDGTLRAVFFKGDVFWGEVHSDYGTVIAPLGMLDGHNP